MKIRLKLKRNSKYIIWAMTLCLVIACSFLGIFSAPAFAYVAPEVGSTEAIDAIFRYMGVYVDEDLNAYSVEYGVNSIYYLLPDSIQTIINLAIVNSPAGTIEISLAN